MSKRKIIKDALVSIKVFFNFGNKENTQVEVEMVNLATYENVQYRNVPEGVVVNWISPVQEVSSIPLSTFLMDSNSEAMSVPEPVSEQSLENFPEQSVTESFMTTDEESSEKEVFYQQGPAVFNDDPESLRSSDCLQAQSSPLSDDEHEIQQFSEWVVETVIDFGLASVMQHENDESNQMVDAGFYYGIPITMGLAGVCLIAGLYRAGYLDGWLSEGLPADLIANLIGCDAFDPAYMDIFKG